MARLHGIFLVLLASGCAARADTDRMPTLAAMRETAPVATPGDAADDPAVWRNPADPAKSLIVGTDKEWGLHVYDLSGALLASAAAGLVNNVDLRADVLIRNMPGVLVAASDRTEDPKGRIALYALETAPAGLRHLAHVPVETDGVGNVYGFCLWRRAADDVHAFIPFNNGDVRQYAIDLSGPAPRARFIRSIKLASQSEGCVVDDRTGTLYVAEEQRGVWRIDAAPERKASPKLLARVDGVRLVPDVEGLAIIPRGARGGYLLASSQADNPGPGAGRPGNAYVAFDLQSGRYVRRFGIAGSGEVDGTSDTDGLEFAPGDFGAPFEDGILVVQDGDNAPQNQNFKMVPGGALKALLERK
jgi:3-phytase